MTKDKFTPLTFAGGTLSAQFSSTPAELQTHARGSEFVGEFWPQPIAPQQRTLNAEQLAAVQDLVPPDAPTFASGLQYIGARNEPAIVNLSPGQGFRYAGPPLIAVGFDAPPV